jgi:hypothetical protein
MKDHELKDALRLITKVQAESKMEPDQWDQLQRAKRELMAVAAAGKLDRQRVFRAVQLIAEVLLKQA